MTFRKSIWNILKISLIMIVPILVYNVGSTIILTENRTHPSPVENCNSQGMSSDIETSQDGIEVYEEQGNTVISVPEDMRTNLSFPQTSIEIIDRSGFSFDDGIYTPINDSESKIIYSVETSQIRAFDKVSANNYTVLPETSGNFGYNIDSSKNIINRLIYIGDEYSSENEEIGCQEFEYFGVGDYDIKTYDKMLERTSSRIPFNDNYSKIKVIFVNSNLQSGEQDIDGTSYSNVIFIEEGKNTRFLLLHEYIHTRQDYSSFNDDMQRPWFTEGTAQYHASNAMKEAGYLNNYEYNFRINLWLRQADNLNTRDAYLSESASINHYAIGPKVFHDYEMKFGDVESYKNREKSISDYYRDYDSKGGNCSTYICKALSTVLGYMHALHRRPIIYYVATPAYIALLEVLFTIKDRLT